MNATAPSPHTMTGPEAIVHMNAGGFIQFRGMIYRYSKENCRLEYWSVAVMAWRRSNVQVDNLERGDFGRCCKAVDSPDPKDQIPYQVEQCLTAPDRFTVTNKADGSIVAAMIPYDKAGMILAHSNLLNALKQTEHLLVSDMGEDAFLAKFKHIRDAIMLAERATA